MHTKMGRFITLEGGEGTGKSTQTRALVQALLDRGIPALATREPGGTPFGEKIRSLIFEFHLDEKEELFLLLALRCHHIRQVIAPALAQGVWVICDRFIDSTLVYQGLAKDKNTQWIEQYHTLAGIDLVPDTTFLCQHPVEQALSRRKGEGDTNRFDEASLAFHYKVEQAYQVLATIHKERYVWVPPFAQINEITHFMINHLIRQASPS